MFCTWSLVWFRYVTWCPFLRLSILASRFLVSLGVGSQWQRHGRRCHPNIAEGGDRWRGKVSSSCFRNPCRLLRRVLLRSSFLFRLLVCLIWFDFVSRRFLNFFCFSGYLPPRCVSTFALCSRWFFSSISFLFNFLRSICFFGLAFPFPFLWLRFSLSMHLGCWRMYVVLVSSTTMACHCSVYSPYRITM